MIQEKFWQRFRIKIGEDFANIFFLIGKDFEKILKKC
jgi:hypothetical protein